MVFLRNVTQEGIEYRGDVVLLFSLSLSMPESSDNEIGGRSHNRIKECLCELAVHAKGKAKDGFFAAACQRYEQCIEEGRRFYPVRISVDIAPVSTMPIREKSCPFQKTRKGKKKRPCSCDGCVLYECVCRLFSKGRVTAKDRYTFAFRLCDGEVCSVTAKR